MHSVPYMLGYAEKECAWRANFVFPDDDSGELWEEFVRKFDDLAPLAFGLARKQSANYREIIKKMKNFYGIHELIPLTDEIAEAYIDAQSDSMFNYGIDVTARLFTRHGKAPTYLYYVSYPAIHTLTNFRIDGSIKPAPLAVMRKATHGTDMLLMWDMFPFESMPQKEVEISRKFIKTIVHFAQTGEPKYQGWTSLGKERFTHLDVGHDFVVNKNWPPIQDRMKFWREQNAYWNFTLGLSKSKDEL